MAFEVTSSAFQPNQTIPQKYTADGADVSPPLDWRDVPAGTKSLAIVCDDPDARRGTWVHWIVWGLPPDSTSLAEGAAMVGALPSGAMQGANDFKRVGYGGPSPPKGPEHRYFFKLYALDAAPNLPVGSNKADLERAMKGHVLAQAELVGRYGR